jgi:hypothetical protein
LSSVGSVVSTNLGDVGPSTPGKRYLLKMIGFQYLENKLFITKITIEIQMVPKPIKIADDKNIAACSIFIYVSFQVS